MPDSGRPFSIMARRSRLVQRRRFDRGEKRETKLNEPSEQALALPYFNMLPKDEIGLLKWRIYCRERALHDHEFRQAVWQMASEDIAFFAVTFCWIHETRGEDAHAFPIDPWPDQVDVMAWIAEFLGIRSMVLDKSRGIGISWIMAVVVLWRLLFADGAEIAIVSKDETALDIRDRTSTLLGKLDFLIKHLPAWARLDANGRPTIKRTTTDHKFENLLTGTSVIGFVPTDDKLRSGRFYFVFFDEFAFFKRTDMAQLMKACQATTYCVIYVSTHKGSGLFHRMTINTQSRSLRISTYWWNNPDRFRGAYKSKPNGQIEFLDPEYEYDDQYEYVRDGLLRSPWFDMELEACELPLQDALEEFNGIAAVTGRKLFSPAVLVEALSRVRSPIRRGTMHLDGTYLEDPEGDLRWFIIPDSAASTGPFIIGCDPSQGLPGGAYAALAVIDVRTGELVLTAALANTNAIQFAKIAVGISNFLAGPHGAGWAQIVYETTGAVGGTFGNELKRLKFPGVWKNDDGKIGYQNPDRGETILCEMGRAVLAGEVFLYDEPTVDEFDGFEYNMDDENELWELEWTGVDGHADRSIALAAAWQGAKKLRQSFREPTEEEKRERCGVEYEPEWIDAQQDSQIYSNRFRRQPI